MTRVSVVVETVTVREHGATAALPDAVGPTLEAVRRQSPPPEDVMVVVDADCDPQEVAALAVQHPAVRIVHAERRNYFVAKNRGASAATGDVVVLLDGDCVPADDWLRALLARLEPGVAVVAGRTRYAGRSVSSRTFSVSDFATVLEGADGGATGILINNVAYRREVLLAHLFVEAIPRNGGCVLQFAELRADGETVVHASDAEVVHHLDVDGFGFVRKHFDRGYDGMLLYRLDGRAVLGGTALVRRFSGAALLPITGRRILLDWRRLTRSRAQLDLTPVGLVWCAAATLMTRLIELAGGLAASVGRSRPAD